MRVSQRSSLTGPCLRRYTIDNGVQYRSEFPGRVNGVTIAPAARQAGDDQRARRGPAAALRDHRRRRASRRSRSRAGTSSCRGARCTGSLRERPAARTSPTLDGQSSSTGCAITGAPRVPRAARHAASRRTSFYVKLPDAFGAPTSEKPIVLTAGSPAQADRERLRRRRRLQLQVPNASIGPIGLDTLDGQLRRRGPVGDRGQRRTCRCSTPASTAKAGILNGDFNYAGAEVELRLARRSARSARSTSSGSSSASRSTRRRASACRISASRPRSSSATSATIDYGVPTFALCGEVGLTGGPQHPRRVARSRSTPGSSLATYDDRPSVFCAPTVT